MQNLHTMLTYGILFSSTDLNSSPLSASVAGILSLLGRGNLFHWISIRCKVKLLQWLGVSEQVSTESILRGIEDIDIPVPGSHPGDVPQIQVSDDAVQGAGEEEDGLEATVDVCSR